MIRSQGLCDKTPSKIFSLGTVVVTEDEGTYTLEFGRNLSREEKTAVATSMKYKIPHGYVLVSKRIGDEKAWLTYDPG